MITRVDLKIRFFREGEFSRDIPFTFYRSLMHHIKHQSCLNSRRSCGSCDLKNQCIYYWLSGENFNFFPSILVSRHFYDVGQFRENEEYPLSFFFLGQANDYLSYLETWLEGQKVNHEPYRVGTKIYTTLDEDKTYNGFSHMVTPSISWDLHPIIHYYHEKYGVKLSSPQIQPTSELHFRRDHRMYSINGNRLRMRGYIGEFYLENMPIYWIEIGISPHNFMGGGHLIAYQTQTTNESTNSPV